MKGTALSFIQSLWVSALKISGNMNLLILVNRQSRRSLFLFVYFPHSFYY